jgi:hypothetical protein
MSEPIPESIPTARDKNSHRAVKRRALSPISQQASQVEALFANPDREIKIPDSSSSNPNSSVPGAALPEIVANVQGSSAGAGSGEFHVYKASRRREFDRLRRMEEEVETEEKDKAFYEERDEARRRDEEKTAKNRLKREKKRAKEKGKNSNGVVKTQENGHHAKTGLVRNPHLAAPLEAEDGNKEDKDTSKIGTSQEHEATPVAEELGIVIHDED